MPRGTAKESKRNQESRKNDDPDRFFLLLTGHAKVTTTFKDGREFVLRILGPGDVFGEIAVLDGSERTADVATTEPEGRSRQ